MALAIERSEITTEAAAKAALASLSAANKVGCKITIYIVDPAGVMKAAVRMDGSPIIANDVAERSAYTALLGRSTLHLRNTYGKPDDEFVRSYLSTDGRNSLVAGGYPIIDDAGKILGAIGVAGASEEKNDYCAKQGVEAVARAYTTVQTPWLSDEQVDEFIKNYELE